MHSRRQALRTGGLVAALLAGCTGSSDDSRTTSESGTSATTTRTTRSATGRTTTSDDEAPLRWTVDTGDRIVNAPVIADGTVYAFGDALHALSTDGSELWTFEADEPIRPPPVVRDSVVYVVTGRFKDDPEREEFVVHALDPDGSVRWQYGTDYGSLRILAATPDAVFVGTHDDNIEGTGESLYALDAVDGSRLWSGDIGDAVRGAAVGDTVVAGYRYGVVGFDAASGRERWRKPECSLGGAAGDAVFVLGPRDVTALAATDGSEQWSYQSSAEPVATSTFDGAVYTNADGTIHALDAASGEQLWRASIDDRGFAEPIVTDYAVHFALGTTAVALDRKTGAERWAYGTGNANHEVAAASDGAYVSSRHYLRAVGPDGTDGWLYDAGEPLDSPAVGPNGVYVGGPRGTLAALGR